MELSVAILGQDNTKGLFVLSLRFCHGQAFKEINLKCAFALRL